MDNVTAKCIIEAGKHYAIDVDSVGDLVECVIDGLYSFEKEYNKYNSVLFELASGMIVHASVKAIGAGIAIGKHLERQRRKNVSKQAVDA